MISGDRQSLRTTIFSGATVILLLVFLFFLPTFEPVPLYNSYNQQRLSALLLMVLGVGLLLCCGISRRSGLMVLNSWSPRNKLMMLILPVLGLLSGLGATYPWFSIQEIAFFCLLLLTTVTVAVARIHLGSVFGWLMAISLTAIGWNYFIGFVMCYQIAISNYYDIQIVLDQLLHKFSHVRFFGQWQSWTLPLMVLPMLLTSRSLPKHLLLLFLLPAMFWWLLLFASGTRGTALGSLVAVVLTLFFYRRRALRWLRWHLTAAIGGGAGYLAFYCLLPSFWSTAIHAETVAQGLIDRPSTGLTGREYLWASAWEMIVQQPLLGVGPMHYADYGNHIAAHPHNALLQIGAEWGLPALFIVLMLFVGGVLGWLRDDPVRGGVLKPDKIDLRPPLFAALITAVVHSMFSGIIIMPVSQVMMVLVLGWMIGIAYLEAPNKCEAPKPGYDPSIRAQILLIFFFALILSGLAKPLSDQLPILIKAHQVYEEQNIRYHTRYLRPRFWQQGYLAPYYPKNQIGKVTQ